MSLQEGTIVAESSDDVCMRVASSTGHLLVWQPKRYAEAAAMSAFQEIMAQSNESNEYAAHAFDSVALSCLHVAPALTQTRW